MSTVHSEARRRLNERRVELEQRLTRIRNDVAHRREPLSADSADRAQEQENEEVLTQLDASTAELLRQCRHALERIDSGNYGICETCGFSIDAARLRSVPHATQCAECASVARKAQ